MLNSKHKILFFCIITVFSLAQNRVEGVSAVVGDNMVLYTDVLQQSQMQAFYQKIDPSVSPLMFEGIFNDVLEAMIDQYVVLSAAEKDTNLFISDDEVNAALEQQINEFILQAGSEAAFEKAVGMSIRKVRIEYWPEIKNMMMIERFKFSKLQGIDVSRVEVLEFYAIKKDSLADIPETVDFSIIEVPVVPGESAENEVKNSLNLLRNLIIDGASFDSIAIINSEDPGSGPSGGNLGFTKRGELVKEYEKIAYSLNIGDISKPVRSPFGYHLIRLNARQGEKISTQHILKLVYPEESDRLIALDSIRAIYYSCLSDPSLFDSLSSVYSKIYKNNSGKYHKTPIANVSSLFSPVLSRLNDFQISEPFETEAGFAIIYLYNRDPLIKPNPDNSWALLYNLAKSYKQNEIFQSWIADERLNTFVKIFKEY